MNSTKEKMAGCLLLVVFVVGLGVAGLFMLDSAVSHWTDYKIAQVRTDGAVAIAKLDAQEKITVGCEENSWFTSMKDCIVYGGVNGPVGISWFGWTMIIGVSFLIAWLWQKKVEA